MLRQQIEQNKRKTIVVMFAFFVLVALIGAAVGYANWNNAVSGVVLAAVLALIYMAMMKQLVILNLTVTLKKNYT